MKELLKNKTALLAIIITLVLGGLIGWFVKPASGEQTAEMTEHVHDDTAGAEYTCSMHPQIRQAEPGQCPLCGMALIPVTTGGSGSGLNPMALEMTPEAVAMSNIHTTRVTSGMASGEVSLTGKIQMDERKRSSITAKFPGRIEKLFVNFTGQQVSRGQRLASIYSPELLTAQKELLEALKTKPSFPELHASAREKLKLWKLTEKQIDEIEKSGKVKEEFDVLADKSGVVINRNVAVGDYVSTGSALVDVADLSTVWVLMDAYESDLSQIKLGNKVSFTAAGIPGKTFNAKVTYIDPIIDGATRTASVRAETSNTSGDLKPEMFVSAQIQSAARPNQPGIAIPQTALLWSGKRSVVYVKIPNTEFPTFEMRNITIGSQMGNMYPVLEGLEAGEEIVTNGVFAIDAAAQLAGKPSMMNPEGGTTMTGHNHGATQSNDDEKTESKMSIPSVNPSTKTFDVSKDFQNQIVKIYQAYLPVKDALIASDAALSGNKGKQLLVSITKVNMGLVKGEAHTTWMKDLNVLKSIAEMIVNEKDVEQSRMLLSPLSDQLYHTLKKYNVATGAFRQFCPMAFNNKGAFWISDSDKILNPYFGDAMLTCGNVEEELK